MQENNLKSECLLASLDPCVHIPDVEKNPLPIFDVGNLALPHHLPDTVHAAPQIYRCVFYGVEPPCRLGETALLHVGHLMDRIPSFPDPEEYDHRTVLFWSYDFADVLMSRLRKRTLDVVSTVLRYPYCPYDFSDSIGACSVSQGTERPGPGAHAHAHPHVGGIASARM